MFPGQTNLKNMVRCRKVKNDFGKTVKNGIQRYQNSVLAILFHSKPHWKKVPCQGDNNLNIFRYFKIDLTGLLISIEILSTTRLDSGIRLENSGLVIF